MDLSERYITDRFLPDKAIDLIDEASSKIRLKSYTPPAHIRELENHLKEICTEKHQAIEKQNFEKAATLRDKEKETTSLLRVKTQQWKDLAKTEIKTITAEKGRSFGLIKARETRFLFTRHRMNTTKLPT